VLFREYGFDVLEAAAAELIIGPLVTVQAKDRFGDRLGTVGDTGLQ
jgi:hypothetical protein